MAVMGGLPHEVTGETLRSSQVAFVRKDDFLRFVRNHPDSYANVSRHIVSWYQHIGGQLRILGLSSTHAFGDFRDRRLISMRGASVTIHDRQALAGVRPRAAARFAVTTSMV